MFSSFVKFDWQTGEREYNALVCHNMPAAAVKPECEKSVNIKQHILSSQRLLVDDLSEIGIFADKALKQFNYI